MDNRTLSSLEATPLELVIEFANEADHAPIESACRVEVMQKHTARTYGRATPGHMTSPTSPRLQPICVAPPGVIVNGQVRHEPHGSESERVESAELKEMQ